MGSADAIEPVAIDVCENFDSVVARSPESPAVTVDGETLAYAELQSLSRRAASLLDAMGVTQDAIVALPMPNSLEQYAFFLGAWRLGATPLPVSPKLPEAELGKILEVAGTQFVVREGQDLASQLEWTGSYKTAKMFRAQTTGGSTGTPKVIIDTTPSRIVLSTGWKWGYDEGPALFVPGPTYHSGPMNHSIEGLSRGLHVITMRRFDAAGAVELISKHKPHWALFVPTMMNRILKLPQDVLAKADLSTLKHVWHSAAYCPAWLKQTWIDLVGPDAIWEIFGGSEGCSTTIINGTEWLAHKGSVGKPFNGEIAIFDEDGQRLPAGEIGEIYMRDDGRPRRFQVTAQVNRRMLGDWESFGDLGWLDADGYLFLADRRVDMINAGGQNIYPAEVEAAIQSHPAVADAVVFGQPDEDLGETVVALVWAPSAPLRRDDLLEYLATQIVRYKVPRRIAFADGPIRNDAGKVRRSDLVITADDDGKFVSLGDAEDALIRS